MTEQSASNKEIAARVAKLRQVHRVVDGQELSHEERVRLENEAVPGIGDLSRMKEKRKERGR